MDRRSVNLFLFVTLISGSLICLAYFSFINSRSKWKKVDQNIKELASFAEKTELKERFFQKTIKMHEKSSPSFFQKELSQLEFGKNEKQRLQTIVQNPAFCGNPPLEARIQTLENLSTNMNQKKIYSSKNFNEVELSLEQPILLEEEELIELLKMLESNLPNKPISEILFFSCKRERVEGLNEMFKVNFTILTKEWTCEN